MENKDFAVFILTHGKPNDVITYKQLKKCGYTGKIYLIIDNEDKTVNEYIKNFGIEYVKVFDKKAIADEVDEGNNLGNKKAVIFARNASFKIAKLIGITYFLLLEDDYYYFGYRYEEGAKIIKNLDAVFDIVLNFYISVNIKSIAFSQGGDHIGGFSGIKLKRKCMNSFFCSTEREFQFVGTLNDDVNTYTILSTRGDVFFTFTNLQLDQKDTQGKGGGMTETYLRYGTYCKSFTTVLMHPSGVKVSMMNSNNSRLHHSIKWINTTPMIIDDKYRKGTTLGIDMDENKTIQEMNNTTDLSKSFSKLISANFINYEGRLLEKKGEAVKWNNQLFYTKEELDKAISKSGELLSNSISK